MKVFLDDNAAEHGVFATSFKLHDHVGCRHDDRAFLEVILFKVQMDVGLSAYHQQHARLRNLIDLSYAQKRAVKRPAVQYDAYFIVAEHMAFCARHLPKVYVGDREIVEAFCIRHTQKDYGFV